MRFFEGWRKPKKEPKTGDVIGEIPAKSEITKPDGSVEKKEGKIKVYYDEHLGEEEEESGGMIGNEEEVG